MNKVKDAYTWFPEESSPWTLDQLVIWEEEEDRKSLEN